MIKILKDAHNVIVGFKEIQEDVIILHVLIFGVIIIFVGFAENNMMILIIKILYQYALVYLKEIFKEI